MIQNAHYNADWAANSWGMPHGSSGMMGSGMHGIFSILVMLLIVVAIVLLIRWLWREGHTRQSSTSTALQVLQERYAKGEIDQAEFLAKQKDLS